MYIIGFQQLANFNPNFHGCGWPHWQVITQVISSSDPEVFLLNLVALDCVRLKPRFLSGFLVWRVFFYSCSSGACGAMVGLDRNHVVGHHMVILGSGAIAMVTWYMTRWSYRSSHPRVSFVELGGAMVSCQPLKWNQSFLLPHFCHHQHNHNCHRHHRIASLHFIIIQVNGAYCSMT